MEIYKNIPLNYLHVTTKALVITLRILQLQPFKNSENTQLVLGLKILQSKTDPLILSQTQINKHDPVLILSPQHPKAQPPFTLRYYQGQPNSQTHPSLQYHSLTLQPKPPSPSLVSPPLVHQLSYPVPSSSTTNQEALNA